MCEGDIVLLSVGELNENKNHRAIIEALGMIKVSDEKCAEKLHYFIAGTGHLQNELVELANKLGVNLHLLGFRSDVPELLEAADIFILPSIREGLNVSLMEAMASEKPCIVSKIRGNTDLIEEGKGGFLFETNNEDDIKNKLESLAKMLGKERYSFGEYNFQKIQKFSCKRVGKRMHDIYNGMI